MCDILVLSIYMVSSEGEGGDGVFLNVHCCQGVSR